MNGGPVRKSGSPRPAGEGETPDVSVLMYVYNHERTLMQAIESVLMQRGSFTAEIIIHDDASEDGSQEIIKKYAAAYPGLIFPILQNENQMGQGINIVDRYVMPCVRGRYIAHCEGDDYWTDPDKLRRQIRFLDRHPAFSGVSHSCEVVDRDGKPRRAEGVSGRVTVGGHFAPYPGPKIYTLRDLALEGRMPGQTAAVVYRSSCQTGMSGTAREAYGALRAVFGDRRRTLLILLNGPVFVKNRAMSAYRYVPESGGSWNARMRGRNLAGRLFLQETDFRRFAAEEFGVRLRNDYALFGYGTMALLRRVLRGNAADRDQFSLILAETGGTAGFAAVMCRSLPGALRAAAEREAERITELPGSGACNIRGRRVSCLWAEIRRRTDP